MLGRVLLLLVIQLLAKQGLIHARPSHDPGQTGLCPSIGLPAGGVREVNLIHDGKPKYRLDLQQSRRGYVPGRTYSIYIRAQDPTQTFGDSLLSVTSESRTCKHGNFSIQSQSYYQPEGCDHMVLKNTREFEHTFSFQWTAPTCGCVILRARVRSVNNVYYLDNKNVIDGYLTKRVCRRQMSTMLSKISHIEREDLLCHVVSKSDDHMVDEDHFLRRRKMNPTLMSVLERDALMVSLSQRVYEVNKCCVQTGLARADCLGDIRRHRIDQLCANTEHLPFTVQGDAYMTERRDNCCWRLGERRYDCFAMGRQGGGVPPPQSDVDTEVATVTNVLDESDPVNDIEDYPNRLSEELVKLNLNHEEPESQDNSIAADIPSKDFVSNSAPRPSHKNMLALSKHTADQQTSQSTTTEKTTPLQQTMMEESTKMAPTPQTQLLKQTTQGLEKKLLRAQMELDCCQQGKQYGTTLITGNTWDRCEQRTRKVTKVMKGKKKRWCRRYHLRCCVEGAQRSGSQNGDIGAQAEIGEERRVSGQQRSQDQVSEQRRLRDQVNEQPRSHDQTDVQKRPQDQVSERQRLKDQVNEQPRSHDQTDVQQRPQGQVSEQRRLRDQVNEQPRSHDQTDVQQRSQGQVSEQRRLRDNVNEQQRPEVQFDDDTIELEQQRLKDTVERKDNDVISSEMTTAMRVENRDRDDDDNDDDDDNNDDDNDDDDDDDYDDDDQSSKNQYQEENFSDSENYEDTEEENEDEYDDQDGGEAEEDEEGETDDDSSNESDFTSHEETISSIESRAVTPSSDQALESIEETRSTEETLSSIDQPEGSITSEQTSEQVSEQSSGQQSRSEELSREDRMRRRKQRQSRRKGRKNRRRKGRKHVSI